MKKILKTFAKKSMSLFMAVVMLMTCWVFYAPVPEAHAARETLTYSLQDLYDTYLTEDSGATFVKGKFTNDNTVPAQDGLYQNVLYSPDYTQTDIYSGVASAGSQLGVDGCNSSNYNRMDVDWHHAETVMLWDGVTTPRTGVMLTTDPNKGGSWDGNSTVERVWMTNSNLSHPSYWRGICGQNLDFTWAMSSSADPGDCLNYLSTVSNTSMKISRKNSDPVPVYANYIQYTGSMDSSKFIDNILPSFSLYVYDSETNATITATSNKYIRVVNYKTLKDAIVAAKAEVKKALDAPAGYYTEASLTELQTIANALVAAKPDETYFNGNEYCYYDDYAEDAKAAVNAWNNRTGLVVNTLTVTFVDAQGTVKTESVLYGGAVTAPTARAKAADNTYHYSFSKWDKTYDNIVENTTVTAVYTGEKHIHEGAWHKNEHDFTHARECTVCANVGWNGEGGKYVSCTGDWGGTDASHKRTCSLCGNAGTHTPNWVEVIDPKYQVPYDQNTYNSCIDDILYYKSCSVCGQAHSTETFVGVDARGYHEYDTCIGHTNHTCTEDGYDTYLCSACGKATENRYDTVNGNPGTDPAAHNWNTKLEIYSDTQHGYKCRVEDCGAWNTDSLTDHSYSTPTGSAIITRPNCYQPGEGTYKCSCGHTYVGEIPATGEHNYNTNKLVEIDENTHGYKCRVEGCPAYQIADDGSEKHVWTLTSTITEPTCSQEGRGNYKCNLCGATKEDSIAINPDAHNHDTVISDLGNGTHGKKCLYAPNDPTHAIEVADHDYDEYVEYDGNQHTFYCETCKTWDMDNLTNHKWELKKTITAPTCSAEGEGKYECFCGAEKTDKIAIDPDAHSYGEIKDLGDGTHGKVCAYNSNHKIEVAAHDWVLDSVITAQTCIDDGSGNYKCTACEATKVDVIEADGKSHKYLDPVSDGNGKHTATCDYCKDNIDEACFDNDKNCECDVCGYEFPHIYDKEVVDEKYWISDADCLNAAKYYKSCQCGEFEAKPENIFTDGEPLGHDYTEESGVERTPVTCTEAQTLWYECSRCDANAKDDNEAQDKYYVGTPALDHEATDKIVKLANGKHAYECIRYSECNTLVGEVDCTYENYKDNADGTHTGTCECGNTLTESHDAYLSDWAYSGSAEEHNHSRYCSKCDFTETNPCDYSGEGTVYTAPVCGKDAYTTYTCQVESCGHSYTVVHPNTALDHIFEAKEGYIVNNADGTHSFKCSRDCGAVSDPVACEITYTQKEDNLKHTALCGVCGYTYDEACAGGTAYCNKLAVCDLCKEEYGAFDPDNHGIEEGINTTRRDNEVEATCTIPGHTADVVCNGCDEVIEKGEDLPVNPDNHKNFTGTMAGTLPTCTEAGYADSKFCLDCKKSIGDGVIPALGHKFDGEIVKGVDADGIEYHEYKCTTAIYKLADGTITTEMPEEGTAYEVVYSCPDTGNREACHGGEATCSDLAECKVCGQQYGEYSAHNFNGEYVQVEGKKEHYRKCEYCDAYGLDGEEGKTAKCTGFFATCTEDSKCEVCGGIYMEKLGHDFENSEVVNCLNNGKHTFKCLRCDVVSEEYECADAEPVKTEATCTEAAYFTYVCDDCGYKWVVESTDPADAAKGHDYTEVQTNAAHLKTAATCTEKAVYWYDCSRCTKNAKDEEDTEKYTNLTFEYGEPAGHKYDGKEYLYKATEATCTENETYYKHCSVCADKVSSQGVEGKEATFEKFGTKVEHDWKKVADEDYLVSEATCSSKAVYNVSCGNCDEVGTDTFTHGDLKAHSFTEQLRNYAHIVTKANCQSAATYWLDCATCAMSASLVAPEKPEKTEGMTDEAYEALVAAYEAELAKLQFTDGELDPNTHTKLTKVPALLPTCTENGHSAYEVCECGVKFGYKEEGYEATDHDFTGDYSFDAETDKHTRLCANGCGTVDENAVACTFSSWTQVEGTETHTRNCVCGNTETGDCVAEGAAPSCVERAKCKDCQGYVGETSEHSFTGEYVQTKNAEGKDAHYKKCANCEVFGLQETVQDEEGNDVVVNVEGKTEACTGGEATCHDKAICDTCKNEYGDQPDHEFGEWYDDVKRPATCLTNSWQLAECKNCDEIKEREVIGSACGHEMGAWTYADEADKPTCKDEGLQTRYCTCKWTIDGKEVTCDYNETQIVQADPTLHIEGEWIKDEGSADCVNGIIWYLYCEVCNKKLDSKKEAGDHKWVKTATVAPTCTEDGHIEYKCDLCGFTNTEYPENLKSEGHAWGEEVIDKAATCGAAGRAYKLCTKCNTKGEKYAIPATGHGPEVTPEYTIIVEPVAATCSSTGHNGYWKCKRCSYDEHLDENSDYKVFPKLPHKDTDGDGLCDECRGKIYADDSGSGKSCGCMCHNDSFLMQFFYKIAKFFWKLFGTNKSCACGYVHY